MILLPIERVLKRIDNRSDAYADDRDIDEHFTSRLGYQFSKVRFGQSELYVDDLWAFSTSPRLFNIADGLPRELAAELGSADAMLRAKNMPFAQLICGLRNALAHGGILYLDKSGNSSRENPVTMLAFVSAKYKDGEPGKIEELRILRVSEVGFKSFLGQWVDWLNASGIEAAAAA